MRSTSRAICLMVVGMAAATAFAADYDIKPVGPQDGVIWNNVGTDALVSPWGMWGFVNGNYYSQAGIHSLPAISAGNVQSAQLVIPANHALWSTNGANVLTMDWVVEHFAALDDTTLTGGMSGTGDFQQPTLGMLGVYATPPWPGQDNNRTVTLDVTAALQADLAAGRHSFAWRIVPTQAATSGFNDNAQLFFPTADTPPSYGYPNYGAQLLITVPEPASASLVLCGLLIPMLSRKRRAVKA